MVRQYRCRHVTALAGALLTARSNSSRAKRISTGVPKGLFAKLPFEREIDLHLRLPEKCNSLSLAILAPRLRRTTNSIE
jgi:hypothetical protein